MITWLGFLYNFCVEFSNKMRFRVRAECLALNKRVATFERKVLRRMFGGIKVKMIECDIIKK
jgi:hypothetical protein